MVPGVTGAISSNMRMSGLGASGYCLKPRYTRDVGFELQDVALHAPPVRFDLVLCRDLVFTYFDESLRRKVLVRIKQNILPGGALVIGIHEHLPDEVEGLEVLSHRLRIYRRQ